jgi:hypothetical protein
MSSETINKLVGSLNELRIKLDGLNGEARRLGELRGDLKSAASGLTTTGQDLRAVAIALGVGAATMRGLDMVATIKRLEEIELTLDARSRELEQAIDREIAALGESLKQQVSKQLDGLPTQIGSTVALAFDRQFTTTKAAIDSLVADMGASHQTLTVTLQSGVDKILADAKDQSAATSLEMNQFQKSVSAAQTDQLALLTKSGVDKILADAKDRSAATSLEMNQFQKSVSAAQTDQLALLTKALAEDDARNLAHMKALEATMIDSVEKARLMATFAFVAATIGTIVTVVSIFF